MSETKPTCEFAIVAFEALGHICRLIPRGFTFQYFLSMKLKASAISVSFEMNEKRAPFVYERLYDDPFFLCKFVSNGQSKQHIGFEFLLLNSFECSKLWLKYQNINKWVEWRQFDSGVSFEAVADIDLLPMKKLARHTVTQSTCMAN